MTTITHGQTIQRRRIIWRLLDKLDSLSFISALKWLRALRVMLVVVAVGCAIAGFRYNGLWWLQTLLALVAWIAIEIMIFRVAVVEMIKELDR